MLEQAWIIPVLPLAAAALVGLLGRSVNRFAGWPFPRACSGRCWPSPE